MPDPILVAHCEYVAGADGLVTFTVTGAPGEVSWRFGDATDEAASADGVTEHTYSAGGTYEAIGHVHSTGQRMVMTVGVPEFESGGGEGGGTPPTANGAVLTSVDPASGAETAIGRNYLLVYGSGWGTNPVILFDETPVTTVVSEDGLYLYGTPWSKPTEPGDYTVQATNDEAEFSNVLTFVVTAGPAATVTGCTPAQFPAGTTPVLTITGTGLLDASGAFLRGDNGPPNVFTPPYPLTSFAVTDDTSVFGNVAADLPGAGNWYVAVTVDGADVYASSTVWCEPVGP